MNPTVTIGIPVYQRLQYLPQILRIVNEQDYPEIELLISDNGMNGTKVSEMVNQHYPGAFKFRQNGSIVSISQHFNQLVRAASGKYFLLLADDDEISPNYVSELVARMESHSAAAVAVSRQEIIDESGAVVGGSKPGLPETLSGTEFIRAAWQTHEYRFQCFATVLARTESIKACGGYPDFTTGTHNDDALLIKLCLNGDVALSDRCCFRWRVYETSHGWSLSIDALAKASREFLKFVEKDPVLRDFAARNPEDWARMRKTLIELGWKTYYLRWRGLYRRRLTQREWVRAAFALPFIPAYYRLVARVMLSRLTTPLVAPLKKHLPRQYEIYRRARYGSSSRSAH